MRSSAAALLRGRKGKRKDGKKKKRQIQEEKRPRAQMCIMITIMSCTVSPCQNMHYKARKELDKR